MTAAFLRWLGDKPNAKRVTEVRQTCQDVRPECRRCSGRGVYVSRFTTWRNPTWRALDQLGRSPGERWGPVKRHWWHPAPAEVILVLAAYGFDWPRVRLYYADEEPIDQPMAEAFALSAVRKFHAEYETGFEQIIPWDRLSDAQKAALDAA